MRATGMRRWLGGGLAFRFSLIAALLAGFAVVLVGGIYWTALVRQLDAQAELALQKDAFAEAERIGGILNAVSNTFASLSENSLFATALIDSAGKETYLEPFLAGMRRVQGIPIDVIFTDFAGQPIATNGGADLDPWEREWLTKAIAAGKTQAVVVNGAHGKYILAAEMLTYDRTNTPEGTLTYRLMLESISLGTQNDLNEEETEPGKWHVQALIPVAPIFQPLNLHIHSRMTQPDAYRDSSKALRGFGIAAALVVLLVLVASRVAGQRLTRSLRRLEELAQAVLHEGLTDKRAEIESDDEVGSLARSFNLMMAFLEQSQADLEAKVVARTNDLRQALERIDSSERRYRSLFSSAKAIMLLIDPATGNIVDANGEAANFYGHDVERLKLMHISDINALGAEEIAHEMEAASADGRKQFNFRHRLASGELRDVEVHSGPLEIGDQTLLFSIIHDITDRRRLEHERRRLVMAIEQSPASVVIAGIDGNIEYVNPAFTRITGYSREEAVGQNPRILKSGETSDEEYRAMWAALVAGEAWTSTFRNKRKDGSFYWENAQISPVVDDEGRITHYLAVKENITAHRAAEEAIRDLSHRLGNVLAAASEVAIIATDRDGTITLFNSGAERMLGYPAAEIVGIRTPEAFHLHEEMLARSAELTAEAGQPVKQFDVLVAKAENDGRELRDWTYVRKDGTHLFVSLVVTPVHSDDGDVSGYLGVAIDITGRKEVEARLRDSEERFRSTFEQAAIGFIHTSFDGTFLECNKRFCDIIGYPPEAVAGLTWQSITHPDDQDISRIEVARMLSGEVSTASWEKRYIHKNGRIVWVRLTCSIQRDSSGRQLHFITAVEDIDRQKTAEARLAREAARYQFLLKTASDGLHVLDVDGKLIEASDSFCRMLGYPPGQTTSLNVRDWDAEISPDRFRTRIRELIAAPLMFETKHRRFDGSVFDVEINCQGIEFEGKNYLYAASRDITDRKTLEEELRKTNAELAQFAYVASHNLRQPLRMVTSYLGLIEKRLGAQLDADIKDFLGFAVGGAKRMDRLILDLLAYSRTGKTAQAVPASLAEAVANAQLNLHVAIDEAQAEIVVAAELPIVTGNPAELTRLFQNLIGNAVKYRVPERQPRVEIGCRRQGNEWLVSVSDNGIGIAPKDHERAFMIFQRLVTMDVYEGTGIGLAVCKKIVEQHGGRIWIESEVGEGSTFLLALPISAG